MTQFWLEPLSGQPMLLPAGGGTTAEVVAFEGIAAVNLSGHRVVRPLGNGTVDYADQATVAHHDGPYWLTLTAALATDPVMLLAFGPVVEPSWTWTCPGIVFLGAAGVLTQTPPTSGLLVQVGAAEEPTKLFFDPDVSGQLV